MTDEKRGAPTISEVAKAAGVGRATAARTLGNYGYVSDVLREKVLAAAEELGYHPNALARSVSTGRSQTIGVVMADLANPFFASLIQSITDTAREEGFGTLLLSTSEHLDEEVEAFRLLINNRVDGIIVASAAREAKNAAHISQARDQGIPVVLIDRIVNDLDLDAVVIANRQTTRDAVTHLLDAGHTRVGFVWGPSTVDEATLRRELTKAAQRDIWTDGQRILGYFDALDDRSLPVDPSLVSIGKKTEAQAQANAGRMLDSPNPPTAFFCTELEALTGTLHAISERGLKIPEDISLIGLDDSSWAEVMQPPLTTVRQPLQQLGHTAAEALMKRIHGGNDTAQVATLETELINRKSVRSISTKND
ncbi:MAG: LacI family DNA-binding transcriptional regulator [Canibacter sp.]